MRYQFQNTMCPSITQREMVLLRDKAFLLVLIMFVSVAFSGFANAHPE